MVASVGNGMAHGQYRGATAWTMGDCRTLLRGASVGHGITAGLYGRKAGKRGASVGNGVTAGQYGRTAGKRGTSGYEPAGKNTPIATGLKAA